MYNLLPVTIAKGMFENEYTIMLNAYGREFAAVVGKESVNVTIPPIGGTPGTGFVKVRVLEFNGDHSALVDLPSPAFTSIPRFRVPEGELRPV